VSLVRGVGPKQSINNLSLRLGDPRDPRRAVRTLFGDEVAEKIKPAWGVNEEGEVSGIYADSGIEGLYQMMGGCVQVGVYEQHF